VGAGEKDSWRPVEDASASRQEARGRLHPPSWEPGHILWPGPEHLYAGASERPHLGLFRPWRELILTHAGDEAPVSAFTSIPGEPETVWAALASRPRRC